MKSNLEKVSNLERRLSIEVPVEKVTEAFERTYEKIRNQVTLKGFRKGKAPIAQIKTIYRDSAVRDVVDELVQKHYVAALEEHALDPLTYPNIKIENLDEAQAFKFAAEFEVRPEVNLEQYKNLPVEREKAKSDESQVEKNLENLRSQRAELVAVMEDRPAKKGDHAVLDFEGFVEGAPLENGAGKDHALELGSGDFIPGFEEGIEGMKVGSNRTVDLKFPDEYHAAPLAGKPVSFKVTLKALKKKDLPALNDEFAKGFGMDSVDKLRAAIQEDVQNNEKKRIEDEFKNRLLKALVDRNPVEVPKSMLQDQKKLLIEDVQNRMQQQGMGPKDFEEYVQKWDDDFSKSATFMIQSSFLINAVANKENLRSTEEEVEARINEYAASAGLEVARLKGFYDKDENRSRLRFKITEEKVIAFLTENSAIRDVDTPKA